jgi:hypothetical protein
VDNRPDADRRIDDFHAYGSHPLGVACGVKIGHSHRGQPSENRHLQEQAGEKGVFRFLQHLEIAGNLSRIQVRYCTQHEDVEQIFGVIMGLRAHGSVQHAVIKFASNDSEALAYFRSGLRGAGDTCAACELLYDSCLVIDCLAFPPNLIPICTFGKCRL